jgi:hypothetical protein
MPSSLNGTGITFSNGSTQSVAATGTVSSVATGNGLSGGTITSTGTLVVACPGFNTVGSYCYVYVASNSAITSGGTYSAGSGSSQLQSFNGSNVLNNLSGTWRWMGSTSPANCCGNTRAAIACRVS